MQLSVDTGVGHNYVRVYCSRGMSDFPVIILVILFWVLSRFLRIILRGVQKWTSHFFLIGKWFLCPRFTLLSVTRTLICLQGMVKEIFITSYFLRSYIQLFHYRIDSKHTVLYANSAKHEFILINAGVRRIGKLAAQHFWSLKSLSQ